MILANSTVTIMAASGLSDDIGVELAPGINDDVDQLISEMKNGFSPDAGVGETLFTLFVAGGRIFLIGLQSTYALPVAMMNLGFPSYLVTGFFAPAYLISTFELVFALTGRKLL